MPDIRQVTNAQQSLGGASHALALTSVQETTQHASVTQTAHHRTHRSAIHGRKPLLDSGSHRLACSPNLGQGMLTTKDRSRAITDVRLMLKIVTDPEECRPQNLTGSA